MIGRSHPWIRQVRALRKERSVRDREGLLVAEGIHLAFEALAASAPIEAAIVSPRLSDSDEGRELRIRLEEAGVTLHESSDPLLQSIQDARSAQPVVLVVRRTADRLDRAVPGRVGTPLVVLACDVQDPGNLGSLVRSADAAGASGFVVVGHGADPFHPRTVRATMGSVFRIPLVRAGTEEAFDALAAAGVAAIGTDPRARRPYTEEDWRRPCALVLGSEGAGLPADVRRRLAGSVAIPMIRGVESVAVPAAGAVILFEAARQRRERRDVTPTAG